MPSLTLRPNHKAVAAYYESLAAFKTLGTEHELAVKTAFATLLETAAETFTDFTEKQKFLTSSMSGSSRETLNKARFTWSEN